MPLTANDVMQKRELIAVATNTTVAELEHILVDRDISGVPVENDDGELVGLVSQRDVIRLLNKAREESMSMDEIMNTPVRHIMETRLRTVSPSAELSSVAKLMRTHHIHRVPVVHEGRVVGLITTLDLVHPLEDPELVRMIWGNPRRNYWTPFKPARAEKPASHESKQPAR